jgi:hypothetical protein
MPNEVGDTMRSLQFPTEIELCCTDQHGLDGLNQTKGRGEAYKRLQVYPIVREYWFDRVLNVDVQKMYLQRGGHNEWSFSAA